MKTIVRYGASESAWKGFYGFIDRLIQNNNIKTVCEVGGGANPLMDVEYIIGNNIKYSILDISGRELAKAPAQIDKIRADVSSDNFEVAAKFDLVFSRMLAEHVYDAKLFHENVFGCLTDNGLAVHFFPTLYAFPFLANYLFPESLANALLNVFAPRDRYWHKKFPAYYDWCRGSTVKQIGRFVSLGYEVIEYHGFFGHEGYYKKIGVLRKLHGAKTRYLLNKPNPYFTSYSYVVLKKSGNR